MPAPSTTPSSYVVNLADNESFVGHIQDLAATQLTLVDVYNLSVQPAAAASPGPGVTPSPQQLNPVICKLGTTGCKQLTGLYGNKDTLYIARNAVIYYSELPATRRWSRPSLTTRRRTRRDIDGAAPRRDSTSCVTSASGGRPPS